MARINFSDPIASMEGKFHTRSKVVMRTRNGRTHAYVINNPNTKPHTQKQQDNSILFRTISQQVHEEMTDATRREYWQQEFDKYRKTHHISNLTSQYSNTIPAYRSHNNTKPITTLYGYIFHTLYTQQKTTTPTATPPTNL